MPLAQQVHRQLKRCGGQETLPLLPLPLLAALAL
jgi:hypothetical protein